MTYLKTASDGYLNMGSAIGSIRSVAPKVVASYPTANLVTRWEADQSLNTSGGVFSSWSDLENALEFTQSSGTGATVVTGQAGAPLLVVASGDVIGASGVGSMPTGSANRTVFFCGSWEVSGAFYGGFAYGTGADDESFGIILTPGNKIAVDYYNGRLEGPTYSGGLVTAAATLSGTTVTLYVNDASSWSETKTLTTGTTQTNLMSAYGANPNSPGKVGCVFVYSAALSTADLTALHNYATAKYVTDVTAPTISSTTPTDDATGIALTVHPTATFSEAIAWGTGNVTLRENDGGWSNVEQFDVTTDIGGGTGTVSINGTALTVEPTASLAGSREYAIQIDATAVDDLAGNSFAGISDDTTWSFTTAVADVTAPVLTAPVDTANGGGGATGTVDTDEGNGTLYAVVTTSATAPSAAQVVAGQDNSSVAAAWSGSQSVSGTGTQSLSPAPSGLAASTAYTIHYMHRDAAGNDSNVASGDGFTTASSSATVTNATELAAELASATGGEIITMANNNYGTLTLYGNTYNPAVTLLAENEHGAVFNFIDLRNGVDGLVFDGVRTISGPDMHDPGSVSNITFIRCHIAGYFRASYSTRVTARFCYFDHAQIEASNSTFLVVDECCINNAAPDVLRVPGATDFTITNNVFYDSSNAVEEVGVHPDFIQAFRTDVQPVRGTIRGNFLVDDTSTIIAQPSGPAEMQGIFLGGGSAGYSEISITQNMVSVPNANGIRLSNSDSTCEIKNNSLIGTAIVVDNESGYTTAVAIEDNLASSVLDEGGGGAAPALSGNVTGAADDLFLTPGGLDWPQFEPEAAYAAKGAATRYAEIEAGTKVEAFNIAIAQGLSLTAPGP